MIKRKILSFILLFFFISSLLISYSGAADNLNETDRVPQPPALTVDAKAAYLVDAATGDVLYAINEDDPLYPASTTKIMTCYLTLKYGNLNDLYTLPAGISSGMDENSSTSNLEAGEELYISELLQCLMISSANEAANALAIYISGSINDFVDLMNEEAAEIGCTNTHFDNPNGLHSDTHYTSAEDLALITIAALRYNEFRNICGTAATTLRATNLSEERTLENTNYLLPGTDFPAYDYDGAEGVKTGHTTPAGYCLVSLASRNGHELLGVVLGASETTIGDQVQIGSFSESISMLDWGFENYDTALVYQQFLTENASEDEAAAPSGDDADTAFSTDSEAEDADIDSETEDTQEIVQDVETGENVMSSDDETFSDTDSAASPVNSDSAVLSDKDESSADYSISAEGISDSNSSRFEQFARRLQITNADLILLLAGCLMLILLSILILICTVKRKRVFAHEL